MYEVAWAAGFFDGEGTTSFSQAAKITRIQISQKDPALLHRFQKVFGLGVVRGPYRNGKGVVWQYRLTRKADVAKVISMMWPFMGDQKREQAMRAGVAPLKLVA